jgi:hypothetical protein
MTGAPTAISYTNAPGIEFGVNAFRSCCRDTTVSVAGSSLFEVNRDIASTREERAIL